VSHCSKAVFPSEISDHSAAGPICRRTGPGFLGVSERSSLAAIAGLIAILTCAPDLHAQEARPGAAVRFVASVFASANTMSEGCARAGGRDTGCWSVIGTPLAKTMVADGAMSRILRSVGIPADATRRGSWQRLNSGTPAFEMAQTDL